MAICGKDCSVSIAAGSAFEGHRFTITSNAPEIDVRTFGAGDYGEWLVCAKDGTISVNSYLDASISTGEAATVAANVAGTTYTATDALCVNKTCDVDAKGLAEFTYEFKIVDDITGF